MNKSTQYVINHYETKASDEEAAVIEDIMKMNGGADKDIIIENLRGWFMNKSASDTLMWTVYEDMLAEVDWNTVYKELKSDIIRS